MHFVVVCKYCLLQFLVGFNLARFVFLALMVYNYEVFSPLNRIAATEVGGTKPYIKLPLCPRST